MNRIDTQIKFLRIQERKNTLTLESKPPPVGFDMATNGYEDI